MKKTKNIILGVTAGIAIYKACDLLRRLQQEDFAVTVVMTPESQKLISPIVFESLSGNQVFSGMFETQRNWDIAHVTLAARADLVVIAPATANIIGKIAGGISDDLLTCVVCAASAPVLICPAMNEGMYLNKITQGNIRKLKSLGYNFVEPRKGRLACGDIGLGCLAEIETIVKEVKKYVK